MVVEGQTGDETTATDTTTAGVTTTTAPQSYVNVDGVLQEGWRDHYVPEDIRAEKIFDSVKDLKGAFSIIANQAKLVGRKGVLLPSEASGPSEWETFYEAIGRPKTAQDYKYQVPEDISSEDLSPEFMGKVFDAFHKGGYTQKHADIALNLYMEHLREVEKAVDAEEERERLEAEAALRAKWGAAYDERLHLANRMLSENSATEKMQSYLVAKYGNDPILGDFLANIASKFVEHKILTDVETPVTDAKAKINELMQSKAYTDANDPQHKTIVQQVQNLFVQISRLKPAGTT